MLRKTVKLFIALLLLLCLTPASPALAENAADPAAPAVDLTAARTAALTALDGHIADLRDNYCAYYTEQEYQLMLEEYAGSFGGVGVSMIQEDGYIVVYKVLDQGPAKDSPIAVGDRIIAVDGESIVGFDTDQAAARIRGEIGTAVTLTLLDAADSEYEITLVRQEITTESVEAERIEESENTAYFLIYSFTGRTVEEFSTAYNRLRQEGPIDWIILDLRSDMGGNFYAALGLAEFFVPAREVVVREKLAGTETSYTSSSGMLRGTGLVVLENRWTASASEVLAGALRDEAGATLIGTTSFGKGITQVIDPLPSGGAWKYTHSRYFTPSGFDLHGVGLAPDIEVADPEDISSDDYFSTDPALDPHLAAALEFIASTADGH
ncbi:MAG: PDZ domain-containing protein [Firmicutes bacterium]|nr:PDZ domain-containing protein [Bacillota bacterium]